MERPLNRCFSCKINEILQPSLLPINIVQHSSSITDVIFLQTIHYQPSLFDKIRKQARYKYMNKTNQHNNILDLWINFRDLGILQYFWTSMSSHSSSNYSVYLLTNYLCSFFGLSVGDEVLIKEIKEDRINSLVRYSGWECQSTDSLTHDPRSTILFVHLVCTNDPFSTRINTDLTWGEYLALLIIRKGVLFEENIWCATLGAAYAAMTRDKMSESHARRAKQFAERQYVIGRKLGDDHLQRRAIIYISFYHIFKCRYKLAGRILKKQLKECDDDKELRPLVISALARISNIKKYEKVFEKRACN